MVESSYNDLNIEIGKGTRTYFNAKFVADDLILSTNTSGIIALYKQDYL